MNSFLITFKPAAENPDQGWPLENLQHLAKRHREGDRIEEQWRFGNLKDVALDDRVFLLLQGKGGPAIIGYGRVTASPVDNDGVWRAGIEFELIVDPAIEVLANRDDLSRVSDGKKAWNTQRSGVLLPATVARELEILVVGKLPKPRSENPRLHPDWTRDELILALDLYFRVDARSISKTAREIVGVSELLNKLPIHADRGDARTFRNPNGVYMKLGNFLRLDPGYPGDGLKSGSREDIKVWNEFHKDRKKLRAAAEAIQSSIKSGQVRTFRAIVSELNLRADAHPIGKLQEIRAAFKGKSRHLRSDLFSSQTTHDRWAFHHGGRSELQFNVGIEDDVGFDEFRYGVAFSYEASRSLPDPVGALAGRTKLFNDFMELNAELFADLRMWHFEDGKRSADSMPGPIPWELVEKDVFVFLGKRERIGNSDYEAVLELFDRLLALYRYVESRGASQPVSMPIETPFTFRSGCSSKASAAVATQARKQLDISLRHNELQEALHRRLVSQFGAENVGAENCSGVGTRVDVVVRRESEYWFYEIKTAQSPRACLREAMGQLLEYAFWPGAQVASRLIVVGESALDKDGTEYLRCLKDRFSLPIEYEQVST